MKDQLGSGADDAAEGSGASSYASTIKLSSHGLRQQGVTAFPGDSSKGKAKASQPHRTTTNLYHAVTAASASGSSSAATGRGLAAAPLSRSSPLESKTLSSSPSPLSHSETLLRYVDVIKFQFASYYHPFKSRLPFIVCVMIPFLTFVARWRHRVRLRRGGGDGGAQAGNAARDVRRKLGLAEDGSVWRKAYKMVEDTVVMAGRGLV